MTQITIDECTKMIRAALKQGFPLTKFSVRKTRSTYNHNIDVSWTDGPTGAQVKPILDRFVSQGFDGMTDCSYYCGARLLNGVEVEVCGNYVSGHRMISDRLRKIIADKLAAECGISVSLAQYGQIAGDQLVAFNYFSHNSEEHLTVDAIRDTPYILAIDRHCGEWFSTLLSRVEHNTSLEEQSPIDALLLPDYINVNATVATSRTAAEEKRKMFKGHTALASAPTGFHCRVGRSYAKPVIGWADQIGTSSTKM